MDFVEPIRDRKKIAQIKPLLEGLLHYPFCGFSGKIHKLFVGARNYDAVWIVDTWTLSITLP